MWCFLFEGLNATMFRCITCSILASAVLCLALGVQPSSLPAAADASSESEVSRTSWSLCELTVDEMAMPSNCKPCRVWQEIFNRNCCLIDEEQRQSCQRHLMSEHEQEETEKRARNTFLGKRDADDNEVEKRQRNRFLGKRNQLDEKRGRNSFLGRKRASTDNEDDEFEEDDLWKRGRNSFLGKREDELQKRARNSFLGKRSVADEVDEQLAKRARNVFLGKRSRLTDDDKRGRNTFLGKRSFDFESDDGLRKRPRNGFLGKRAGDVDVDESLFSSASDSDDDIEVNKKARNRFLGKRARNTFLGK